MAQTSRKTVQTMPKKCKKYLKFSIRYLWACVRLASRFLHCSCRLLLSWTAVSVCCCRSRLFCWKVCSSALSFSSRFICLSASPRCSCSSCCTRCSSTRTWAADARTLTSHLTPVSHYLSAQTVQVKVKCLELTCNRVSWLLSSWSSFWLCWSFTPSNSPVSIWTISKTCFNSKHTQITHTWT